MSITAASELPFPALPKSHKLSAHNAISQILPHLESSFASRKLAWQFKLLARASSPCLPLGGSGAEYTDQPHGTRPNQETENIVSVYDDEVEDPTLIADPDSRFCEFYGVHLHHKICESDSSPPDTFIEGSTSQSPNSDKTIGFPMILLHGFGASVFSWNQVMNPLARVTGSKVLAFDRPAFGLTSRVSMNQAKHSPLDCKHDSRALNPYSMMFSVLATLYFIDFMNAQKAILVGHSAGALVALDAYFEAPERVAAMIFVSPAIFAPLMTVKVNTPVIEHQNQQNTSDSNFKWNPFLQFVSILSKFVNTVAEPNVNTAKGMAAVINDLYKKALSPILLSEFGVMVIRLVIGKFGIPVIRNAWYDANQISDHVLQGYTKPLKVKGWDKALAEYTVAMLTGSAANLPRRLGEISCPVLIVTGDTDRLVPAWNSERLSRAIPVSSFEVIKNCGHLPQEEKPDNFLSIVDKFLKKVFIDAEEESCST